MNRVWWRTDLETPTKFVLLAIADTANDGGSGFMLIDTICTKTGLSRRRVQLAISELLERKFLQKKERRNRSSIFRVCLENLPYIERQRSEKEDDDIWGAQDAPLEDAGGEQDARGGAPRAPRGAPRAPITVTQTSSVVNESTPCSSPKGETNLFGDDESIPEIDPDDRLIAHVLAGWQKLAGRFNGICAIEALSPARKKKIIARASDQAKATGMTREQVWDRIFEKIPNNIWLRGDAPPGRGRTSSFRLTVDYVVRPDQFGMIFEGGYDGRKSETFDEQLGRDLSPVELADRKIAAKLHGAEERANRRSEDQGKYYRLPAPSHP